MKIHTLFSLKAQNIISFYITPQKGPCWKQLNPGGVDFFDSRILQKSECVKAESVNTRDQELKLKKKGKLL